MMNQQKLMQQAMEMQRRVTKAQEEIAQSSVTGTAGGGAVSVTMTGGNQVTAVTLSKEVVDPEDIEMLQDMLVAALNDAATQVEQLTARLMGPITGGMNIPGFNLPGMG